MKIDPNDLSAVGARLKRAQGQLGGIVAMIEAGRDCEDIVTQLAAVSKAVDRAGFQVIATGLRQCMADPDQTGVDVAKLEKLFLSLA
ncbi:MAG: metal-sensitive transcriptional regulator [Nigerium sp.]|nr:metal-sensitive transcriptional regulator [Nigerium sp.]